ncbi:MAG: flagellin [Phenylobacterium sp.]
MTRISTANSYSSVLDNLMGAQRRQMKAGEKLATQKNGTDLQAYAKNAEMLSAMRSAHVRLEGYLSSNATLRERLTAQDAALNQVADAAKAVRERITAALANGSGEGLMIEIESDFRNAVSGLNTQFAGKPLFAGGQVAVQPVTAQTLSDLTTAGPPPISSYFQNDDYKIKAKLDDANQVTTGLLAKDLGTDLLTGFRAMQTFEEGATGNFGGQLTAAQEAFLESQLQVWDDIADGLTTATARNGMVQRRVEDVGDDLTRRRDMMQGMIGNIVDADLAQAANDLQQAQLAVSAAAQVFVTLRDSSLLNVLQP